MLVSGIKRLVVHKEPTSTNLIWMIRPKKNDFCLPFSDRPKILENEGHFFLIFKMKKKKKRSTYRPSRFSGQKGKQTFYFFRPYSLKMSLTLHITL